MHSSFTCLGPDELKRFIAGDMSPKRVNEIEDHISTCETCRGSLEETVGDRAWWQDLESALRSDTGDSEYENIRSKESACQRLTALLGPTDDPSMLGRIGAYEIIGLLGYGGMGAVFKARDPGLNRYVAIKILLPHLALSGAARARFRREGQAAAAIIDDCVLPIYAVDEWQGIPYLVMQYTRGVSLQRRLQEHGPLELKEALRIGLQAARGLAAAHAQGLVHRDVKPSNILLNGNVDRALLTDFGLARAVDDASLTTSGMIAGTPQYMSPEQARAETVGHRSDLFSLGSVMYAMCTGHAPFRAESSYSVLRLITDKEPRPIREINPDVPEWLCTIIGKLMEKQASDRFSSADQVVELLQVCLAHLQSPTTVELPAEVARLQPKRFSSRFPKLIGVLVMCCLPLVAILFALQVIEPSAQTGSSKLEKSTQPSQSSRHTQETDDVSKQSSEGNESIADESILMISVDSILPSSEKGHPFIVKNSSIALPLLDKPMVVSGRSTTEIESAISEAYMQQLNISTKARIKLVKAAKVINVTQKAVSGIWKAKQIISAGQVVPPEKAPDEFVFRRNQMIWKFTGKTKADDRVYDVEFDFDKSPAWITLHSQDPKRPQAVLGLIDSAGRELRIFTQRDSQGQPSPERPTAIGTGHAPGTDLMILELKSLSIDEIRFYSIADYVPSLVAQWKESSNGAETSEEAMIAKVTEVGNKLVEEIDQRFGPCNVIEYDATSKMLIIDHAPPAHRMIEAFLKESIPVTSSKNTISQFVSEMPK